MEIDESADNTTGTPQSMEQCMDRQNAVGWSLVMCGLLDDTWGAYQEKFFAAKQQRRVDETGLVWSTQISSWIIREARQLWLDRNREVHEPENGNSKAEQETLEQVRLLYKLREDISYLDRTILDEPIDMRLQRPISVLQQWVRNTAPVLSRCINDYQQKIRSGQRDIRQYLQRQQPNAEPLTLPQSESINPE